MVITANIIQEYLERQCFTRLNWLARCPDLNSIKHVSKELQVRISARQVQPRSTQELYAALVDEQNTIQHAVLRKPEREYLTTTLDHILDL
jgi:hypothetical protein